MTKITITMEVDDDFADAEHDSGVNEAGFMAISAALSPYGDDVDIQRNDDA